MIKNTLCGEYAKKGELLIPSMCNFKWDFTYLNTARTLLNPQKVHYKKLNNFLYKHYLDSTILEWLDTIKIKVGYGRILKKSYKYTLKTCDYLIKDCYRYIYIYRILEDGVCNNKEVIYNANKKYIEYKELTK